MQVTLGKLKGITRDAEEYAARHNVAVEDVYVTFVQNQNQAYVSNKLWDRQEIEGNHQEGIPGVEPVG